MVVKTIFTINKDLLFELDNTKYIALSLEAREIVADSPPKDATQIALNSCNVSIRGCSAFSL